MTTAISGRTRLLAILGDPIAHASSPGLINSLLVARGVDAVMVPMRVSADQLVATVVGLRGIGNLAGAIVTMPHKIRVIDCLDRLSPSAARVGACNMLRRNADGALEGTVLDGDGFVTAVKAERHCIAEQRVLLLGAGGAATAIAFALCEQGVGELTIHNRTTATADGLQRRLSLYYPGKVRVTERAAATDHQIVINATSLGMRDADDLPLDPSTLNPSMLAVEIVIRAEPTPFLTAALQRGCRVQHGGPMLAAQLELMLDYVGFGRGQ